MNATSILAAELILSWFTSSTDGNTVPHLIKYLEGYGVTFTTFSARNEILRLVDEAANQIHLEALDVDEAHMIVELDLHDRIEETWLGRLYVEGRDMISYDNRPKATGQRITIEEVYRRYGVAAFEEINDKGSFIKPDRENDDRIS